MVKAEEAKVTKLEEGMKAADLLINSSIPEDHKTVLAKLRDQLPLLVSTIKSATETEEENMKKLETRKTAIEGVNKLKAKFELAKAKKQEMEKRASVARAGVERLHLLLEVEEAKVTKLEDGMKATDKAISSPGEQRQLASSKAKAEKWTKLVSKAKKDKSSSEQKWETLKFQLTNFVMNKL